MIGMAMLCQMHKEHERAQGRNQRLRDRRAYKRKAARRREAEKRDYRQVRDLGRARVMLAMRKAYRIEGEWPDKPTSTFLFRVRWNYRFRMEAGKLVITRRSPPPTPEERERARILQATPMGRILLGSLGAFGMMKAAPL
jgi:hypothetical protein